MSQLNLLQYSLLRKYSFNLPDLPSRLKCVLCNSILKNSKQTSCGCKACEKCIKDYLSIGPKPCPSNQPDCVDRLTMEDILQDNATNREIGNLTVECPLESCTFSSTLKNMAEHIDKCEFQEIECEKSNCFKCGIEEMSKELIDILNSALEKVKEIKKELRQILESTSEFFEKVNELFEESEKQIVPSIQTVTNIKEIFRNGNFIWKITDFEIRRIEAESGGRVSVTSDPFYTSEFGYKMCLRIYPAGDGVGKGTHLALYFAIMKGEFDDILSWPFKKEVTLSIFDLESGKNDHSETFKPDTRSICYQKPTEGCNIASGSPRFISLSQLSNNSMYCKKDTIYIKVSVSKAN